MFFRREKPRPLSFSDRLDLLRKQGFHVEPDGSARARISRDGCAAVVEDAAGENPTIAETGIAIGKEIGHVVDLGYQKILRTPGGRREPALATQLKALHAFQEDLREALGLKSLYNLSLGTVNDAHLYDRVKDRDRGVKPRAWER